MASNAEVPREIRYKRVARRWQKTMLHPPEPDAPQDQPSFILESTYNTLLTEFNILLNRKGEVSTFKEQAKHAYHGKGLEMVREYLEYFRAAQSPFLSDFGNWLDGNCTNVQNVITLKDAMCVGGFLVIKSFHEQLGNTFLEGLRDLPPGEVSGALNESGSYIIERLALIDRARVAREIPEEQMYLRKLVDYMMIFAPAEIPVKDSAGAMYHLIEKCWNKLKPSRLEPPPLNSQLPLLERNAGL